MKRKYDKTEKGKKARKPIGGLVHISEEATAGVSHLQKMTKKKSLGIGGQKKQKRLKKQS